MGRGENEYHDIKTVQLAIDQLSEDDMLKLCLFVKRRLFNVPSDKNPYDLINESIARTLSNERRWNKKNSLFKHLALVIKSICSDHWRSVAGRNESLTKPLTDCENELESQDTPHRNMELKEQNLIYKVQSSCKDKVTLNVFNSVIEGLKRREAIDELNIEPQLYDTCRKRIVRIITVLYNRGEV